jgi:DNA-binding MarR family transcriptional regulator
MSRNNMSPQKTSPEEAAPEKTAPDRVAPQPGGSVPRQDFRLAARPGYLLHKAAMLLDENAEQQLASIGMSAREFFVLAAVDGGTPLSQQDISKLLNLDPTTVVAVIDELERRDYVARRRNPDDRRRYILGLTDSGRSALADAEQAASAIEEEFFGALSSSERETLHDLLGRVMAGRWPASVCER